MLARPRPIADPVRRRRVALAVALILLVSTGVRLWQLSFPDEYVFDDALAEVRPAGTRHRRRLGLAARAGAWLDLGVCGDGHQRDRKCKRET